MFFFVKNKIKQNKLKSAIFSEEYFWYKNFSTHKSSLIQRKGSVYAFAESILCNTVGNNQFSVCASIFPDVSPTISQITYDFRGTTKLRFVWLTLRFSLHTN